MNIVKKHPEGVTPKPIKTLSAFQRDILAAVFVTGKEVDPHERIKIINLVSQVRESNCWFICDCKQDNPPLMTVTLRDTGALFLKRLNNRSVHADSCIFKGIEYERSESDNTANHSLRNDEVFNIHRSHSSKVSISDADAATFNQLQSTAYPRIARVLFTLIEEAKLNVISANQRQSIADQYRELQNAAEKFYLAKEVPASEFLFTHPNQVKYAGVKLKEHKNNWPSGSRPYALLILTVDEYQNNTLITRFKEQEYEIELAGSLNVSSGRLGKKSGPYLSIVTITDSPEKKHFFTPYQAYVIPTLSKYQLVPLDSHYERLVLQALEKWILWWKSKGLDVSIKKPLFDIPVKINESEYANVKPDFLIKSQNKTILLEVAGSHEADYIERKKRTQHQMERLGKVFEFDALQADQDNQFDLQLKNCLKAISRELFSK